MTPDGRRFVLAAAVLAAALGVSCSALAADGGSGTYTVSAGSYDFDLVNRGTTPWQAFTLTAPTGTAFVGGATAGEITVRCVPGQPDGLPTEILCGPLSATGLVPGAHVLFVATLTAPVACGAPFGLAVSSTGSAPFTGVGDAVAAGGCAAPARPAALRPPAIRGRAVVGARVTVVAPSWSAVPARVTYRWQLCGAGGTCRTIAGATAATLLLGPGAAGRSLRLVATASFGGTTVTSVSRPVAVLRR